MRYGQEKNLLLQEKNLLNANRNFSPCNVCNVRGELIGSKHADYWSNKISEE